MTVENKSEHNYGHKERKKKKIIIVNYSSIVVGKKCMDTILQRKIRLYSMFLPFSLSILLAKRTCKRLNPVMITYQKKIKNPVMISLLWL